MSIWVWGDYRCSCWFLCLSLLNGYFVFWFLFPLQFSALCDLWLNRASSRIGDWETAVRRVGRTGNRWGMPTEWGSYTTEWVDLYFWQPAWCLVSHGDFNWVESWRRWWGRGIVDSVIVGGHQENWRVCGRWLTLISGDQVAYGQASGLHTSRGTLIAIL